jgi:hypothetical protein
MKQYLLLFVMCFSVNGSQVWADNFIPKRKAGLWQISVNEVGKKQQHGLKQCIDELTDQKMMQMGMDLGGALQQSCTENKFSKTSDGFTTQSSCKLMGSSMVSRGTFRGNFDSKYTGIIKTTFTPPFFGHDTQTMQVSAQWLGACPSNMTPGDMISENGQKINVKQIAEQAKQMLNDPQMKQMQEMMNNPEFAKQMRRLQEMGNQ